MIGAQIRTVGARQGFALLNEGLDEAAAGDSFELIAVAADARELGLPPRGMARNLFWSMVTAAWSALMPVKMKVNWPDVETAFERNAPGLHSYIDRRTGEVVVVVDDAPEDEANRAVIAAQPELYVRVEPASPREQYRWLEQFVASVQDAELRQLLVVATDGKGAFRRFKDVLLSYPEERERWFSFRANLLHGHINRWLEARELEPDPPRPWGEVIPPSISAKPLLRTTPGGEGPVEMLRARLRVVVETLPVGELYAAQAFLEFLRDRGSAELMVARPKLDPHKPFHRPGEAARGESPQRDGHQDGANGRSAARASAPSEASAAGGGSAAEPGGDAPLQPRSGNPQRHTD